MKMIAPGLMTLVLLVTGCATTTTPSFLQPAKGQCAYPIGGGAAARTVDPPPTSGVATTGTATFTLSFPAGDVTITGDRSNAPCTVNSFEALAKQGYFNDTNCHRLADSGLFMLQCGDPTGTGRGGPGYTFADELAGTKQYQAGTVAMANRGRDTNGSQFFFVYQDSPLPANYAIWGHLDARSLEVIRTIAAAGQDGSNPDGTGKPKADARIVSVTLG